MRDRPGEDSQYHDEYAAQTDWTFGYDEKFREALKMAEVSSTSKTLLTGGNRDRSRRTVLKID